MTRTADAVLELIGRYGPHAVPLIGFLVVINAGILAGVAVAFAYLTGALHEVLQHRGDPA